MRVAFELLVAVTVLVTALTIGLDSRAASLRNVMRRRRALFATVFVNGVMVPVTAFVLVNAYPVQGSDETGVVLCAICAGGPLGLKAAQLARGDLAWAVSIISFMTVLNAGLLPLWTSLLLPVSMTVRPADLLGAMFVIIVLPMAAGVWYRQRSPARAAETLPRLEAASTVTLALAVAAGLLAHVDQVWLTATSWTPVVIVMLMALAGPAGYFACGPPNSVRDVSTVVAINRGTGIALLVASRSFADQGRVISAVITFGILQTIVVLALAFVWRGRATITTPAR